MKKKIPASFTVEAVFLFPIVLAVIFLLMALCLHLHDKVIFRAQCHDFVNEQEQVMRKGQDPDSLSFTGHFYHLQEEQVDLQGNPWEMKLKVRGDTTSIFALLPQEVVYEEKRLFSQPAELTRLVTVWRKQGKEVTEEEQLRESGEEAQATLEEVTGLGN